MKYKEYRNWVNDKQEKIADFDSISYHKTIPDFFGNESLLIRLVTHIDSSNYTICLFKGRKLLQKIQADMTLIIHNKKGPIRIADINGDGLLDLKIMMNGTGCGLAAEYSKVIYLFQRPGFKFTLVSYTDMMYENRTERDLNGDGNYEIITKGIQNYKEHNYWVFNIYNYKDNNLINVNHKFDYPIMIQNLYRQNYVPASFTKKLREKYSLKHPEEFDVKSGSK